ncbi:hypothetical protein A1O1_00873 [Capronia coronata CBS 617.96]|uniref:BTB domain transcription factor n=1 Tax=Capronia coronata CBS 617.96 TaxID=1182541 RepID=W9ZML8_9EURO|nr:uncharacterized protein A1O1_00873 [Capronia coronata CBS 617.96]EXJ95749.1 hypothetical protein A1O1_00873 [Capronia coronata CBS 617.96]
MTGRRSSARIAAQSQTSSSPSQPKSSPAGKKRKNEATGSSPTAKRGRKNAAPEQKTLEETIQNGGHEQPEPAKPTDEQEQVDKTQDKPEQTSAQQTNGDSTEAKEEKEPEAQDGDDAKMTGTGEEKIKDEEEATAQKEETKEDEAAQEEEETKKEESASAKPSETNGTSTAVIPDGRAEEDVPSSILEKGIIYFFFRARVNVDDPQDVNDIARTYIVLRPLPLDAKLGDGPIGDQGNSRLLALPKKVLPRSGRDRFLAFVEKAKTSFSELKDSFLPGSDHVTKTQGTSHTPPATPLAEGVYAITSTGRESHLAYIITIPGELGEVQKEFGLQERGSFVLSVKNPTQPGPGNTNLPKGPEYPQEILDEFRDLRWKPLDPKYLDYPNTQVLIIGGHWDKATEQRPKDDRENNAPPEEELDKLEGEDEIRVKHLNGDDAVFADLGVASKDFPKVPTTW